MIQRIIKAVSIAINSEFGGKYRIYPEAVTQGLKQPCFFVLALKPTQSVFLGRRYHMSTPLVIQYIPQDSRKQNECTEVAERLADCLEYVTCPGEDKPIEGTGMNWEIVDGVLNFFVYYDLYLIKKTDDVLMGDIQQNHKAR